MMESKLLILLCWKGRLTAGGMSTPLATPPVVAATGTTAPGPTGTVAVPL